MTQKMVNGELVDMTPDEEAELQARKDAAAANAPKLAIREQIKALEATMTPRRIREAALGIDSGWLEGVNNSIAALRAQL